MKAAGKALLSSAIGQCLRSMKILAGGPAMLNRRQLKDHMDWNEFQAGLDAPRRNCCHFAMSIEFQALEMTDYWS